MKMRGVHSLLPALVILAAGCVSGPELVLYNNSGRELPDDVETPTPPGACRIVPLEKPVTVIRTRNESGRRVEYRLPAIPDNFRVGARVFAQFEADGRVFLVRTPEFPVSTVPAQPEGFPARPFTISAPEFFRPELKALYRENRFAELETRAKTGDPAAAFLVGTMLIDGRGVAKNPKKSLPWLLDSAAADFPPAQCLVGSLYLSGGLLEKNPVLAMRLLIYAAKREYVPAQTELARCYYFGTPPPVNYERALYWLGEAEKHDPLDPRLLKLTAVIYQEGKAVPADPERARACLLRAGVTP